MIDLILSTARMPAGVSAERYISWGAFVERHISKALALEIDVSRHRAGVGDEDNIEGAASGQETLIRAWLRGDGWQAFLVAEKTLTSKEEKALQVMRILMREKGYPPTVRELAASLELGRSRTHILLTKLQMKGAIEWDTGRARGIRIVGLSNDRETLRAALRALPLVDVTTDRGTLAHVALVDVETLLEAE